MTDVLSCEFNLVIVVICNDICDVSTIGVAMVFAEQLLRTDCEGWPTLLASYVSC